MINSRTYILSILFLALSGSLAAQAVHNNGAERRLHADRYFRINYGNDYFTATDYYLTQTIHIEMALPALGKLPAYKLFLRPYTWEQQYGIALEHNAYTPVFYERETIQYGDRPFAGSLFLKPFHIATDPAKKQRLSAALSLGILGPGAGGKQMQVFIHEHTHNVIPRGWDNQVSNDLILNYEMYYSKELFAVPDFVSVTADGLARFGSLNTKAGIGFTAISGYFDSPFLSLQVRGKKIQAYLYDHAEVSLIAYDATMQGGLFNHNSSYTIKAKDISRVVFRSNWGIIFRYGNLYLEYYQSFMTKEFRTGADMRNGGVQLGFTF